MLKTLKPQPDFDIARFSHQAKKNNPLKNSMNELNALRVFCKVVECGGFSQAARALELSPASVTYTIKELEKYFHQQLFKRTTRRLSLSSAGERCYASAKILLGQFGQLEQSLHDEAAAPRGKLRVEIASSLSSLVIVPALPAFLARYPDLELTLSVNDRVVSPIEDRADIFIRIGAQDVPQMVSRLLFSAHFLCAASPEYLARCGVPQHPDELSAHTLLGFIRADASTADNWLFTRGDERISITPGTLLHINHAHSLCEAARHHLGMIYLLDRTLQNYLQAGQLTPVLTDWGCPGPSVHILYPEQRHRSQKVKAFVSFMRERFDAGKGTLR